MKDICIVTAYKRPEMLHECLRRIQIAQGALDLQIWVCLDNRNRDPYNIENLDVIRAFKDKLDLKLIVRQAHEFPGNSYNVLESYKAAFRAGPQYVFMVEDDVMVAKDFFHFHYAAHALTKLFCSVAVKCTRRKDLVESDDPSKIFLSTSDYASLGVCFPHDSLSYIVPYATEPYYSNTRGFINAYFKDSPFKNEDTEQDGLILRVMGHWNQLCAWPKVPRAFHAGYYGYHRMDGLLPMGPLENRIQNFHDVMFDENMLRNLGPNHNDIHPCNLDGSNWSTLDIDETY